MSDIQAFDFSVNLLRALLWQYNEARNLQSLLEQKSEWYEGYQTAFWSDWITDVFDLRTANDFGLSVWSILLGQPLFINNGPSPLSKPTWGLGSYYKNFNRGNFSTSTGSTYRLPTEIARILLQLRYFQLTSSGTVPETNRMLRYVFKDYGLAYLQDLHDMTQRYVFTFLLPQNLVLLFNNFDILPRPAGVGTSYIETLKPAWGFGPYHVNFTHGNFGE